jgi:hypothetical protein
VRDVWSARSTQHDDEHLRPPIRADVGERVVLGLQHDN